MSSFSGTLPEFGAISVDQFSDFNLSSTVYLLSHAHSDHMVGLDSAVMRNRMDTNSFIKLYCHPVTKALLCGLEQYCMLRNSIESLEIEEEHIVPVFSDDGDVRYNLAVTLIPAAHCPGSVMFLLKHENTCVLYTGDFRVAKGDTTRIR